MDKKDEWKLVHLDEVLKCMSDEDELIRMAAKSYYDMHYLKPNRLHNDRPSK